MLLRSYVLLKDSPYYALVSYKCFWVWKIAHITNITRTPWNNKSFVIKLDNCCRRTYWWLVLKTINTCYPLKRPVIHPRSVTHPSSQLFIQAPSYAHKFHNSPKLSVFSQTLPRWAPFSHYDPLGCIPCNERIKL